MDEGGFRKEAASFFLKPRTTVPGRLLVRGDIPFLFAETD